MPIGAEESRGQEDTPFHLAPAGDRVMETELGLLPQDQEDMFFFGVQLRIISPYVYVQFQF